jgi:hypothetical protein
LSAPFLWVHSIARAPDTRFYALLLSFFSGNLSLFRFSKQNPKGFAKA